PGGRSRFAGCSSKTSSGCVASTGASNAQTTRATIRIKPIRADRSRAIRDSTKTTLLTRSLPSCGSTPPFSSEGGYVPLRTSPEVASAKSLLVSFRALARIDGDVRDVDQQVDHEEDRARPHREPHHRVVVRANDRVHGVGPDPGPVEDG